MDGKYIHNMKKTKEEVIENKVVSERKYTITLTQYSDGSSNLKRDNAGFTALELLGILTHAQNDVLLIFAKHKTFEANELIVNGVKGKLKDRK
jgi:hypothetical protein